MAISDEVVLALEPLADDLHVQQPEEAAAEPEAERARGLGLVGERRVVEPQPLHRLAQVGELVAVDRIQAAEHHRLGVAVALERLGAGRAAVGDRLADLASPTSLIPAIEVADLARAERRPPASARASGTPISSASWSARAWTKRSRAPLRSTPLMTRTDDDHAAVLVVVRVEDQRLQRRVGVARRRRDPLDHRVEQLGHPLAGLGARCAGSRPAGMPSTFSISSAQRSGSAAGRSILLSAATISRSCSSAR